MAVPFALLATALAAPAQTSKAPAPAASTIPIDVEADDADPDAPARTWTVVSAYTGSSYAKANLGLWQFTLRQATLRLGQSLLRVSFPSLQSVQGTASGWGDMQLFYLAEKPVRNGHFGVGLSFSIPTANGSGVGSGKWSLGPAAGYGNVNRKARVFTGFLMQSFFAVAGLSWRAGQSLVLFQPIVLKDLGAGWSLRSADANWAFDLVRGSTVIPLSLGVGKLLGQGAQRFNIALADEITVVHANAPSAPKNTIKLTTSMLYP